MREGQLRIITRKNLNMVNVFDMALFVTAVLTALISGLFYGYWCSVNIGLGRLTDAEYLRAMQSINRAILNPWFFASFIGTLITLPLTTWLSYTDAGINEAFYLLAGASLVYIAGVFGVTIFGNVPLNEALDRFETGPASTPEINSRRRGFEVSWNRFHVIRTGANLISLLLVLAAIFNR